MALVEFEHVSRVYPGRVRALDDFSLRVEPGELMVLVGPSGSGKTTTLRLLAGLDRPTGGTIRIDGHDLAGVPARERDVAMVFQRPALYPHLTVRRNLAFGLRMRRGWRWPLPGRRMDADRDVARRVEETAALVGLPHLLDRYPAQLSGGEQQRVALGRAVVRRPRVFLLDEPLSHLDGRIRAELRQELHLLQRRLTATMIYVTHDQAEALTLGDRVAVLDRGVLQQVDQPLVLYRQPANRFVAGFLGWPAMNFFDGRLAEEAGRIVFVAAGWQKPVPPEKAGAWAPYLDRPVTLGVRPEDVRIVDAGPLGEALPAEVLLVEGLGHASLVTLAVAGRRVTARLYGPGTPGRRDVGVDWHMARSHLFDARTGLNLEAGHSTG